MQMLCQDYKISPRFIEAVYGKELCEVQDDSVYSKSKTLKVLGR